MGFGVTSSAPCLAGVFGVCSFLFVTIWVAPENRARGWLDSRLYCFNAGFSGVPNGPYAHVFNRRSDFVHKPTIKRRLASPNTPDPTRLAAGFRMWPATPARTAGICRLLMANRRRPSAVPVRLRPYMPD